MNRTIRAILGAVLILIIAFSGITICQNLGGRLKVDITEQGLYTLSDGTKAILGRLNQPITAKLFYAETAAMKAPDQIQFFNNYFEFVKSLLEEYAAVSRGMVKLEVIDPRPFSDDEEQAIRHGLQRFPITEDETFFFGLVVQTQFGVDKVIPFFSPDRHNFVEYDISYLIDTAITKQKKKIGIMSSLPVMGQDAGDYMTRMMQMQGQQPEPPWTIVEQLRNKYEVNAVATDVNEINDVDILVVVHPKDLPETTQFAIDQFILKGGRAIVCVDPHCVSDRPQRNPMQMSVQNQNSSLDRLMRTWGLDMPANTFAGDRSLALVASVTRNQRAEKIIGFLELTPQCFNDESVITTDLNQVRMVFPGVLKEIDTTPKAAGQPADPNQAKKADEKPALRRTPLVTTTKQGNSWKVASSFELMFPDPAKMMASFIDGAQPVAMGYLVTGRFQSSFPEGIEVDVDAPADPNAKDPNEPKKIKKHIAGLKEATERRRGHRLLRRGLHHGSIRVCQFSLRQDGRGRQQRPAAERDRGAWRLRRSHRDPVPRQLQAALRGRGRDRAGGRAADRRRDDPGERPDRRLQPGTAEAGLFRPGSGQTRGAGQRYRQEETRAGIEHPRRESPPAGHQRETPGANQRARRQARTGQYGGGPGRDHGRRHGPGNLAQRPPAALYQPRQRRIGIYYLLFVICD